MPILAPFLMTLAGANEATVARADVLNQLYVECLFDVSRQANQRSVDVIAFPGLLAASCSSERSLLREVLIAVLQQRGLSQAAAGAEWAALEAQARSSVERAYSLGRQGP